MSKLWIQLPFLVLAIVPRAAYGQNADGIGHAKCAEYRNIPLATEAASIPLPKDWPICASYKLYSGIGTRVDLEAARRCAWSERLAAQAGLAPKYTLESVFGGSAMLTVLYANGEGVERSIPLALRFACETNFDGDFDDIESLHLEAHGKRPKFVLCNEAKTEFSIGFCAGYQQQIDDQERESTYRKISEQWPAAHKAAFEKLLVAEANYAKAHATGETELSGSGRAVWEINSEESIKDDFLSAINAFETEQFPKVPARMRRPRKQPSATYWKERSRRPKPRSPVMAQSSPKAFKRRSRRGSSIEPHG